MKLSYVLHIAAGTLSLLAGFVALYTTKGKPLHRRAGLLFVCAMLPMCAAAVALAISRGAAPALNIPAALLTAALVITSLTTVREPSPVTRVADAASMLIALLVASATLVFGIEAARSPTGLGRNGMPAFPFFMFAFAGVVATVGDVQVMRFGRRHGARRIARHLWRMTFALFVAALSFFIGQAAVFPEPIRIRPLLALPVLAVLITLFYWLWRVGLRQSLRGLFGRAPGPADASR